MKARFDKLAKIEDGTVFDRFAECGIEPDPNMYYRAQSVGMIAWSLAKGLGTFGENPQGEVHMDRGISGYYLVRSRYTDRDQNWEAYQFGTDRKRELAKLADIPTVLPTVAIIVELDPAQSDVPVTNHYFGKYYTIPQTSPLGIIDEPNRDFLNNLFDTEI